MPVQIYQAADVLKPRVFFLRLFVVFAFLAAVLAPSIPVASAHIPDAPTGNPDTPLDVVYEAGTCADPNYAIATAGIGLNGAGSGSISLSIPASATVVQAYLFYVGYDSTDTAGGDSSVTFQRDALTVNSLTAVSIGGPSFWQTAKWAYAFQADVTSIVAAGSHTYNIGALTTFSSPVLKTEGAQLVVVYKDASAGKQRVYLYAGMDLIQTRTGPPAGSGSIPVVVGPFDTASVARTVQLATVVGGGNLTPASNQSALWYTSGTAAPAGDIYGATQLANNAFTAAQGNYWDSYSTTASLPAGHKYLTVQVESKDTNGAALEWVAQAIQVPLACPEAQVTKTRTSNAYVLEGGTVTYKITVLNVGNTTLNTIPFKDTFDTVHLNYSSATPTPNTANEAGGTLDWTDLTAAAPNGFNADLAPGQSFEINVTFSAAVANGFNTVLNTAKIIETTTKDENNNSPPPSSSSTTVTIVKPSVSLQKTATTSTGTCPGVETLDVPAGSVVKYCYLVTNTGDTYLSNIVITDDKIAGTIGTIAGPLAPGATASFVTANATISVDTTNTGTVVGTPTTSGGTSLPNIPNVTSTDPANVRVTGSIGDFVWNDTNANGIQDSGETGKSGVVVNLYSNSTCTGTATSTQNTNASGAYSFSNLLPGNYCVQVAASNFTGAGVLTGWNTSPQNQGADDTKDSDGHPTTHIVAVTLASGATDNSNDFGFWNPSSLGDFVWNDANANGIQDSGEAGISSVSVNLYANGTCVGSPQTSTTTNGSGIYAFNNLIPGTYCVQVASSNFTGSGVLVGWNTSPKDQGADDAKDSDGDVSTHNSPAISLAAGTSNITIDFAFWMPGSIGDRVWNDINGNGIQDVGEAGINSAAVKLYSNATCSGTATSSTTTSNGAFSFGNLPAGSYCVQVDAANFTGSGVLTGWNSSPQNASGSTTANDSNGDAVNHTAPVVLAGGVNDATIDFGFWLPACLGDIIFVDSNGNGVQDGCSNPSNPLSCAESTGIQNVPISVSGPNGFSASLLSGSSPAGLYLLQNLLPGTYTVSVPQSLAPNFVRTSTSPRSVTLVPGQCDLTLDFGYVGPTRVNILQFATTWRIDGATLSWQAVGDTSLSGFDVYRSVGINGKQQKINTALVEANNGEFTFSDLTVKQGEHYFYWLVSQPLGETFGPWELSAMAAPRLFFPALRQR